MAYYMIVSRLSGLVMDVKKGSDDEGTAVQMWKKKDKKQRWWYDDPETGTIRTKINDFCLDVEDGAVRIMPYKSGDNNQQWERDVQSGYIRNRTNHNRVLEIADEDCEKGAKIRDADANGGAPQMWNFEGPGAVPAAVKRGDPFFIVSQQNNKVVDVKDAQKSPGAAVIMWNKKSPPADNQLWYCDPHGFIRSALTDYSLDADSDQVFHVQPYSGSDKQKWKIDGNMIKNHSNGQVLDIVGANNADGAHVCSWKEHGKTNQQWRIEYV